MKEKEKENKIEKTVETLAQIAFLEKNVPGIVIPETMPAEIIAGMYQGLSASLQAISIDTEKAKALATEKDLPSHAQDTINSHVNDLKLVADAFTTFAPAKSFSLPKKLESNGRKLAIACHIVNKKYDDKESIAKRELLARINGMASELFAKVGEQNLIQWASCNAGSKGKFSRSLLNKKSIVDIGDGRQVNLSVHFAENLPEIEELTL
jgi:hypothetical protein